MYGRLIIVDLADACALNLGCGVSFVQSSSWINLDWQSNSSFVRKHNLLKGLPFEDNCFTLVYSSHLLEHLTQEDAYFLLTESYRVLKPNGTLRLSLPDFEEMARTYVELMDSREFLKSQFVMTEILDQCTRLVPSGSFPKWYKLASTDIDLEEFIRLRTGISMTSRFASRLIGSDTQDLKKSDTIKKLSKQLRNRVEKNYIRLVIHFLPKWFRSYHVSLATPGERHMWLYDFTSLADILAEVGFQNIEKISNTKTRSQINDVLSLDFNVAMKPVKGKSNMFIEASKPN